jgi:hypothetical protein
MMIKENKGGVFPYSFRHIDLANRHRKTSGCPETIDF